VSNNAQSNEKIISCGKNDLSQQQGFMSLQQQVVQLMQRLTKDIICQQQLIKQCSIASFLKHFYDMFCTECSRESHHIL